MPMETLTLPKDVVSAIRTYARRERKSVEELFLDWLGQSYGFRRVHVVGKRTVSFVRRRRSIPQDLIDITGVISLPSEKSDDELVREAILQKYENLK